MLGKALGEGLITNSLRDLCHANSKLAIMDHNDFSSLLLADKLETLSPSENAGGSV